MKGIILFFFLFHTEVLMDMLCFHFLFNFYDSLAFAGLLGSTLNLSRA